MRDAKENLLVRLTRECGAYAPRDEVEAAEWLEYARTPDCAEQCGEYDAEACAACSHRVDSYDVVEVDEWT